MAYDYDLTRNTGRPSQLMPVVVQTLREAGLNVHPGDKKVLIRLEEEGTRIQAKLEFVPESAGVLRLEIPVTSIPSPPPDAFFVALAEWNAKVEQLRAHTLELDDQVRVVLRASLIPNQAAKPAFGGHEVRQLLSRMVHAKSGLQSAIVV
jgi:hypothetical protein